MEKNVCVCAKCPKQVFIIHPDSSLRCCTQFCALLHFCVRITDSLCSRFIPSSASQCIQFSSSNEWYSLMLRNSTCQFIKIPTEFCGLCEWRKYKKNAKSANENPPENEWKYGIRGRMQFYCVHISHFVNLHFRFLIFFSLFVSLFLCFSSFLSKMEV